RPVRVVDHETGTGTTRSGRMKRPASRGAGDRCGGALRGGPETACRSRRAGTKSALGEPRAVPGEVGGGDAEVAAPVDQRLESAAGGERLGRADAVPLLRGEQLVERGRGAGGVLLEVALAHPLLRDDVEGGAPAAAVVLRPDRRDVTAEDRES